MKLELVLLTILVGLITESQVKAQIDKCVCHEFRNKTGKMATYYVTPGDVSKDFPSGPGACTLTGFWLFYDTFSAVNAMWANDEVYYPGPRVVVRKILRLSRPYYASNVLYLVDIDAVKPIVITKATKNITDNFYGIVVYYSKQDWTVESKSHAGARLEQTCFPNKRGIAAFSVDNPVYGIITSATPGKCLGKKIVPRTRIPECLCNQGGVVDDANKCNGINGICNCLQNNTGPDCGWCVSTHGIKRDGTCEELGLCGCNPRGVSSYDYSCNSRTGKCHCHWRSSGDKCEKCSGEAFLLKDSCQRCNCPWKKVNQNNRCEDYTGKCNCRPPFVGDICERCAANYTALKELCLTARQKPFVDVIYGYCKNNETDTTKVIKAIDDLKTEGIVNYYLIAKYWMQQGFMNAKTGACTTYQTLIT